LVFDGSKSIESAASGCGESPFELYEREEAAQRLRNAIDTLPLKYRTVVEVLELNEKSLSDSQASLGISTSAAKSRLFRARRRLGVLLRKVHNGHELDAPPQHCMRSSVFGGRDH
jgi:DNA-directed RNA polymerase specialized sigma24 family protein